MAKWRTNRPFAEEVEQMRSERGLSVRALANAAGVSQPYLWRLLRQVDYKKRPSRELARAVAKALDLPEDYFAEFREAVVVEKVRTSPRFRDHLYDSLRRERSTP
jgi:transcriptional regulator with XRE-family HTH domain